MSDDHFMHIIKDLREAGHTDASIAREIDCSRMHIGQISRGEIKNVGYWLGKKLDELHATCMED